MVYKVGLVAYCVVITVTTFKHAGAHESELLSSEKQQAIYVSRGPFISLRAKADATS